MIRQQSNGNIFYMLGIARRENSLYLDYLEIDLGFICPTEATCCSSRVKFGMDKSTTVHSMPNFTLICAEVGYGIPKTVNFTKFGNINAS